MKTSALMTPADWAIPLASVFVTSWRFSLRLTPLAADFSPCYYTQGYRRPWQCVETCLAVEHHALTARFYAEGWFVHRRCDESDCKVKIEELWRRRRRECSGRPIVSLSTINS